MNLPRTPSRSHSPLRFRPLPCRCDPRDGGSVTFGNDAVKGLFMPDGPASCQAGGKGCIVLANDGDFREDNADRANASTVGATGDLANLRIVKDLSSAGDLYAVRSPCSTSPCQRTPASCASGSPAPPNCALKA